MSERTVDISMNKPKALACIDENFSLDLDTSALRDFALLSAEWFWEQDAQFRFTRFFGISPEKLHRSQAEFLGKSRWEMPIFGLTPEQLAEHVATYARHESFRDFEYQTPGENGVLQHYSVSGTPMFDEQGTVIGYRGVGRNITELRNAEKALRESERQLSCILDGCPIATFAIDAEHRITHWNAACAKLTGLRAEQMLGQRDAWRAFYSAPRPTMADLVVAASSAEEVGRHYRRFNSSALIDGAFEAEAFFQQMGESGCWLYFTAAPLHDSEGNLVGALETLQDVTDRRRAEILLESQKEALQKSYDDMEVRVVERTAELSHQVHFLQQLIEAIPGPVFYKDDQLRYLGCNSAFEAFIGHSANELIGKLPHEFRGKELADQIVVGERRLLNNPGVRIYESRVPYANGEMRDVMIHKATFTREDGAISGIVGLMLDITERKRLEEVLRQAAKVFDSSSEGIIITTLDGSIIAVNQAFSKITGYSKDEVIGQNPRILHSGRHDSAFFASMWRSVKDCGHWEGEVWNRRKNGEIFPEWLSINAVYDELGQLSHYVGTCMDITQQKSVEEKIYTLAFSDPLTGLPNRRLLLERLNHTLVTNSRTRKYGALFFLDLDAFKYLNDTKGHAKGDILLLQVARRLATCVRESDTVARLGGDEFVILLEDLNEEMVDASRHAEALGSKILDALNQPYDLDGELYRCTSSIGIALFSANRPNSVDELLQQADLAMYRAKAEGRNAIRFFDPEMQTIVAARVAMEADMRLSLEEKHFVLYFQPQVNHAGRITGAEALLRWRHPVSGTIPPGDFIPLAEETGLILELGQWVLDEACACLQAWATQAGTAQLTLAINVSAQQFQQHDFVDRVLAALDKYQLDASKLKLEITESLLLHDVANISDKIEALKARGVLFSLDDFGTGYSSLSYLKRLPIDQIKIDKSFVAEIIDNIGDAAIASAIIALAHSLGLDVIAEGVETEAQFLFLAKHGCVAYQGYLFGRPETIDDFESLLKQK